MAAKGYPGDYKKGTRIEGLDDAAEIEGVEIFHAGTVAKDGAILANGGRVLNVCAMGKTVLEAQQRAYQAVDRIKWPDGFCRRDIAWQAVEQEKANGLDVIVGETATSYPAAAKRDCIASLAMDCFADAARQALSKHAADGLRHLGCRKGPQRFGANIAERSEAQRERHEG